VKLLPFVLCLVVLVCVVYNIEHLLRTSALAAGLAAVGAVPDFSRSVGLGVAEMVVAGLLAIVTATALTGRYRAGPATIAPRQSDPDPADGPPIVFTPIPVSGAASDREIVGTPTGPPLEFPPPSD
ncbi:hypothetical protein, partial [Ilumatobacter sp.]|uniref:hypothetical protein n=1 Tax=Ilumatobacter sp. TaxID=1967498 RepID=UPI003C36FF07